MTRIRSRALVLLVALSGVAALLASPVRAASPGGGIRIVSPADKSQLPDAGNGTGLRVNLKLESMPANTDGVHIDPTEWNRSDGFSPGAMILAHVPGIDLGTTGAAPVTDIARSLDANAPIVLIDAVTGEHHPFFAELDATATSDQTR